MLRELDKKLIERESHRFDTKERKTWLKPISECPLEYEDIIRGYNLHELTMHWYDAGPGYDNETDKCKKCKSKKCSGCPIWDEWDNSEKQLTFNNWIDVEGPDIWGMTQEECNERTRKTFENEILPDLEFNERVYFYQPPDDKYFDVFWYNRDRKRFDYWFIFKKKAGVDLD